MKYRKIYIFAAHNSVKQATNYKNEKADITAGRHLHDVSGDSAEEELRLQILRFCPRRPLL